ncbi:MAG: PAS domain-containing protein [Fervidicoccaceae archaeon]
MSVNVAETLEGVGRVEESRLESLLEAFRQAPSVLFSLLDSLDFAVVLMDPSYRLLYVNEPFARLYGLKIDEIRRMLGKRCYELLRGASSPCSDIPCPARKVVESRSVEVVEQIRTTAVGLKKLVQVAYPLFRGGELVLILKVVREDPRGGVLKAVIERAVSYSMEPAVLLDSGGKILNYNEAFERLPRAVREDLARYLSSLVMNHEISDSYIEKIYAPTESLVRVVPVKASGDIMPTFYLAFVDTMVLRAWERLLSALGLRGGRLYYLVEEAPSRSLKIFEALCSAGFECVAIARSPPDRLGFAARVEAAAPSRAVEALDELLRRSWRRRPAVYVDGLYYLHLNAPGGLARVLPSLRDLAETTGGVVLLSISPSELSEVPLLREILMREGVELPHVEARLLPKPLAEVLKVLRDFEARGITPSLVEVARALRSSKPTVIKRIRALESLGYVEASRRGRTKLLRLSEKGRSLSMLL